ncbi:hypothetical protein EON81_18115 [bacterium]|nr:MAG: hypothetical protein EON81_18115 [bacterium]
MTERQKRLVLDLVITPSRPVRARTPEQFLEAYETTLDGQELTRQLMQEAVSAQDGEGVEYAMVVGFTFGFDERHLEPLLALSDAPWHNMHENAVSALGDLKTPRAVDALYRATQWVPEYLEFDEARALAVKAIWALGAIEDPRVDGMLESLTVEPESILGVNAAYQIQRRALTATGHSSASTKSDFLSSERTFEIWEYEAGRSQLLLRSPKAPASDTAPEEATNIDVLFIGVEYVALPRTLSGIEWVDATPEELASLSAILGRPVEGDNAFVLRSGTGRFSIVASDMSLHGNRWDGVVPAISFHNSLEQEREGESFAEDGRILKLQRDVHASIVPRI